MKMTEQRDALAEAKEAFDSARQYFDAANQANPSEGQWHSARAYQNLQFAQTAALIAIAESLQKEKQ